MSVLGLTCHSPKISPRITIQGLHAQNNRVSAIHYSRSPSKNFEPLHVGRAKWVGTNWHYKVRKNQKIRSAMDASFGDMADDPPVSFPRMNIRDPYKRLGISTEASEGEIQAARNFLIKKYSSHKPSVEAIESAHDKILMQQFHDRNKPKLNIKKKVKDVTQSRVVLTVTTRFQTPATSVILRTAAVFALLGVLTVLFPTEDGPTVQVALSFFATIYFIHDRLKSKVRALLYGYSFMFRICVVSQGRVDDVITHMQRLNLCCKVQMIWTLSSFFTLTMIMKSYNTFRVGAFGVSWLLGTFMMVSVIPPVFRGLRSLEVTTALISYLLLWVCSTYLK